MVKGPLVYLIQLCHLIGDGYSQNAIRILKCTSVTRSTPVASTRIVIYLQGVMAVIPG